MANELFSIEWQGLKELRGSFEKMEAEADKIMISEYSRLGKLAEKAAKRLVHHDEGTLEDSLNFDRAKREGKEIVARGGSNLVYALRRHEEPYRMGVHDKHKKNGAKIKDYYVNGRGRATHRKPSWRGYKPGRKYLENAIRGIEPNYETINARILDKILRLE